MNSPDRREPLDDLDARIRQSLRLSLAHKYPSSAARRRLLQRAVERRSSLRKLTLTLSEWLSLPRVARRHESVWHHLDYINVLTALGHIGFPYLIR
jgi:hypothetical protein